MQWNTDVEDQSRRVVRTFDGTPLNDVCIADETDPWLEVDGVPVTWPRDGLRGAERNDCGQCAGEPVPGALTRMNSEVGIQRCDTCIRFAGDLDAALALAELVGGVVKFEQEPPR